MNKKRYIVAIVDTKKLVTGKNDDMLLFEVECENLKGDIALNLIKKICVENNINFCDIAWGFYDTKVSIASGCEIKNVKINKNRKIEFIKHLVKED